MKLIPTRRFSPVSSRKSRAAISVEYIIILAIMAVGGIILFFVLSRTTGDQTARIVRELVDNDPREGSRVDSPNLDRVGQGQTMGGDRVD